VEETRKTVACFADADQKRFLLEAVLHAPLDPPSLLLCYKSGRVFRGHHRPHP
jgi:hypothetical protein